MYVYLFSVCVFPYLFMDGVMSRCLSSVRYFFMSFLCDVVIVLFRSFTRFVYRFVFLYSLSSLFLSFVIYVLISCVLPFSLFLFL